MRRALLLVAAGLLVGPILGGAQLSLGALGCMRAKARADTTAPPAPAPPTTPAGGIVDRCQSVKAGIADLNEAPECMPLLVQLDGPFALAQNRSERLNVPLSLTRSSTAVASVRISSGSSWAFMHLSVIRWQVNIAWRKVDMSLTMRMATVKLPYS